MLIDSHCHLCYAGLSERQHEVLAHARETGVAGFLNISTRENEWNDVINVAERNTDVWASVGIHPHEADEHPDIDTARIINAAAHKRVIGIGETGLDYFYEYSDREKQKRSFRSHIAASRQTRLPLIIHTRDAESDTLQILRDEMERGDFPALIHCFTASQSFAEQAIDLGLYISISGIVTFKNAKDLQATASKIPADRMLVETDAPFLAPVPHRGKKGEPAFVADTARFVAMLRGQEFDELAEITSRNFFRLFDQAVA